MRKLFSKRAGSVFNSESPNITFAVGKKNIEIVGKVKSGLYVIIYLVRTGNNTGMLFANWGQFFGCINGNQELMSLISKYCPTYHSVLIGNDKDSVSVMNIALHDSHEAETGLGMPMNLPDDVPLINCLDENMVDKAELMMNKMVEIYSEFQHSSCPSEWKDALIEVWE